MEITKYCSQKFLFDLKILTLTLNYPRRIKFLFIMRLKNFRQCGFFNGVESISIVTKNDTKVILLFIYSIDHKIPS